MHGSRGDTGGFAYRINAALMAAPSALTVIFCPPELWIDAAARALPQNARLALGAQNCHASTQGAFTGSTSAAMLQQAGARYVIIGHSERRAQYGETDAMVLDKARAAIEAGLTPIICVGETEEEYARGATKTVLRTQLEHVSELEAGRYLIAYEPVWAIGSGKTPTTGEIEAAHAEVKSALGSATAVLYGGSVKSTNINEILACKGVSGALIGGASLDSASMCAMIEAANAALKG